MRGDLAAIKSQYASTMKIRNQKVVSPGVFEVIMMCSFVEVFKVVLFFPKTTLTYYGIFVEKALMMTVKLTPPMVEYSTNASHSSI